MRHARGVTLVELIVASAAVTTIMAAATAMLSAGAGVARSTNDGGAAGDRASRALNALCDGLRRGSLASVCRVDGTAFADGAADAGFQVKEVLRYRGAPTLGGAVLYRFDAPTTTADGALFRVENGVQQKIASGLTSLSVTRAGTLFTIDVRSRSGPKDDRARTSRFSIRVAARNP